MPEGEKPPVQQQFSGTPELERGADINGKVAEIETGSRWRRTTSRPRIPPKLKEDESTAPKKTLRKGSPVVVDSTGQYARLLEDLNPDELEPIIDEEGNPVKMILRLRYGQKLTLNAYKLKKERVIIEQLKRETFLPYCRGDNFMDYLTRIKNGAEISYDSRAVRTITASQQDIANGYLRIDILPVFLTRIK